MVSALITGASGSIGSAVLRHLRESGVSVTGIDLDVDIRDRLALRHIFDRVRPQVVFHAAALKHVPELESQPFAAVETNIFGTVNVACAARETGVRTVVLLSTDKAVRPVSVMGRTKRIAEQIFQALDCTATQFVTVRFGNVLGSSGSVVPIFQGQIKAGGPVTVTHPEMERYFLTSEEAVRALIQAAEIATCRDVCVPEMSQPISILALANQWIAGRPIPIQFTGIRPGEKLSEQLWDPDSEEFVRKEGGLSIYRPRAATIHVWEAVEALRRAFAARDQPRLLALLSQENPEN